LAKNKHHKKQNKTKLRLGFFVLGSLGNWIKPNSAGYPTIFKVITPVFCTPKNFESLYFSVRYALSFFHALGFLVKKFSAISLKLLKRPSGVSDIGVLGHCGFYTLLGYVLFVGLIY